jgi:hypothetical protein
MIVGPITVAIWPLEGPMKVRPAPMQTWFEASPVPPWPSSPEDLAQAPAVPTLPTPGENGTPLGVGMGSGVLAAAAGAPAASGAAATSAATRDLRGGIMVSASFRPR